MAGLMEIDEQVLAAKFEALLPYLDERGRRLVLPARRSPQTAVRRGRREYGLYVPACRDVHPLAAPPGGEIVTANYKASHSGRQ
jgi:hypothetical protein